MAKKEVLILTTIPKALSGKILGLLVSECLPSWVLRELEKFCAWNIGADQGNKKRETIGLPRKISIGDESPVFVVSYRGHFGFVGDTYHC